MRKYRHFDEDFKRGLVARIDSGAITQALAAREYNLSSLENYGGNLIRERRL